MKRNDCSLEFVKDVLRLGFGSVGHRDTGCGILFDRLSGQTLLERRCIEYTYYAWILISIVVSVANNHSFPLQV